MRGVFRGRRGERDRPRSRRRLGLRRPVARVRSRRGRQLPLARDAPADGTRGFVTVDDLDAKLWLGDTRESVARRGSSARSTRLGRCATHGLRLRGRADPDARRRDRSPARARATPSRSSRSSTARPAEWGEPRRATERAAVLELLARAPRVHAGGRVRRHRASGCEHPGRHTLEAALRELDRPWAGGPFSEPAREGLARHASGSPSCSRWPTASPPTSQDAARRGSSRTASRTPAT